MVEGLLPESSLWCTFNEAMSYEYPIMWLRIWDRPPLWGVPVHPLPFMNSVLALKIMSHRIYFVSKCCKTDLTVYHAFISWEDQKFQQFADISLRKHFLLSYLKTECWSAWETFWETSAYPGGDNELQTKENKI